MKQTGTTPLTSFKKIVANTPLQRERALARGSGFLEARPLSPLKGRSISREDHFRQTHTQNSLSPSIPRTSTGNPLQLSSATLAQLRLKIPKKIISNRKARILQLLEEALTMRPDAAVFEQEQRQAVLRGYGVIETSDWVESATIRMRERLRASIEEKETLQKAAEDLRKQIQIKKNSASDNVKIEYA